MSHWWALSDPGGAQLGLRQYFQQKSCPRRPARQSYRWCVERIDPGAAVYVCLVADRWPAAHAGESTPDRYADGSLAALPGVYRHPLVGYGIWGSLLGRYETWRVAPLSLLVPVVGMASAALLLGETLSGLQLAGAALIMAEALYQRFRSSGAAWHGAGKKAPETGLCVCV